MTLEEVAEVYRLKPSTIRRMLQRDRFRPLPIRRYPYRWRREDIQADLAGPPEDSPRRAHGFARLRPAKASLPDPTRRAAR